MEKKRSVIGPISAKDIVQKQSSALIVTEEDLKEKFGNMSGQITKYDKISMELAVENAESLKIAEGHSSSLLKIIQNIEQVRKTFKQPYLDAGRDIDNFAKQLSTALENSRKRINHALVSYKTLEQARLMAEENERKKKAMASLQERELEAEKMDRIQKQIMAKLYGGSYVLKSGEVKTTAGCIDERGCSELAEFVRAAYPKPDTFKYLKQESEAIFHESLNMIHEHMLNVKDLESKNPDTRQKAEERIKLAKVRAKIRVEDKTEELEEKVEQDLKQELKDIEKESKEVGKGLRDVIKFKIVSEEDVPVDFLSVDEKKVNAYVRENRERILTDLEGGKISIKGLHLYVEKSFISR